MWILLGSNQRPYRSTEIGQSIIDKAAELKITIWQVKAVWNGTTNKISFDKNIRYVYDKAGKFAKGDIVPGALIESLVKGAMGVTIPLQLQLFPGTNFDLDPEELQ